MKFKNIICYILSFLLIFSAFAPCMIVGADETEEKTETAESAEKTEENADGEKTEGEEGEDGEEDEEGEEEEEGYQLAKDYIKEGYVNEDHKLSEMTMYFEDDKYEIWGLEETGEVAFRVKATGQVLLTNPYDVPTSKSSDAVKQELMEHCRKHVAKYAMPYDIEFRDEMPKTLVGKVAYRVLEEIELKKLKEQA